VSGEATGSGVDGTSGAEPFDPLFASPAPPDAPAAGPPPGAAGPGEARPVPRRPVTDAEGFEQVDRRWIAAERAGRAISLMIVGLILGVGTLLMWLLADWPSWLRIGLSSVAGSIVGLQLVMLVIWPPLSWRRLRFRLDRHGLEIRRGVLWRSVTNVPRSRIQHTDVTQGPLARRFRLATLSIHTAGTEMAEIELEGLARPRAMRLRDELLQEADGDGV